MSAHRGPGAEPKPCTCPRSTHTHGTFPCYVTCRCRCRPCSDASADYWKAKYRQKMYGTWEPRCVDSTGTRRRVQALMTLGWAMHTIAARAGVTAASLNKAVQFRRGVERATAVGVARVYDELWDTRAVGRNRSERISVSMTLGRATRGGYVPPLGWDDDTIDDPAARPQHNASAVGAGPGHRPMDNLRVEAIDDLERVGMSAAQIALRVGCTSRTVQRRRALQRAQDAA